MSVPLDGVRGPSRARRYPFLPPPRRIPLRRGALALALLASLAAARPARGQELYRITVGALDTWHEFGRSLAGEGDLLAVGGSPPAKQVPGAWIVRASTGSPVAELIPPVFKKHDEFGWSVALSGGVAAVGAPKRSVYGGVFVFDATSGALLREVPGVDPNRRFGWSVAIDGGVMVVGDPVYFDPNTYDVLGAAHVIDLATGAELHRFIGSPSLLGVFQFGASVAVGGGRVMVGAPGEHAVHVYDLVSGMQLHRLEVGPPLFGYQFGIDVAIEGDLGLVGSPVNSGPLGGAAYLYDLASGDELRLLRPPELRWDNRFGASVDLRDGLAAVGATGLGTEPEPIAMAYLFDVASGELLLRARPDDGQAADRFGSATALADGVFAVGAPRWAPEALPWGRVHAYCGAWPVGSSYCGPASKNSTGQSARLEATGCDVVDAGFLRLRAKQLPPNRLGLFLASLTSGFVPFYGGSQGHLCLGGTFGRVSPPADSGIAGQLTLHVDLDGFPPPLPPAVQAGETWYFQAFFRDRNPGPTSNLTDGLEVAFR